MSILDHEQLLRPLSDETPCGEDLVYDPEFTSLERAAAGKTEQQFGDTIIPGEGPDWSAVKGHALELFSRTKDLRVAVFLSRAMLMVDGFPGLEAGLKLVLGLMESNWEHVHPQLDPDDAMDPIMRVNTLAMLCDTNAFGQELRDVALVTSRALGSYNLRSIHLATGKITLPEGSEEKVPGMAEIDGAFLECAEEELTRTTASATGAKETLLAIKECLADKIGEAQGIDPTMVLGRLAEIENILVEKLQNRGLSSATTTAEEVAGEEPQKSDRPTQAPLPPGEISSRGDVIRQLDKMCQYFEKHEPSSPVPLLLRRAKRLAGMDFLTAIRDLAPDGVSQVEMIGGVEPAE